MKKSIVLSLLLLIIFSCSKKTVSTSSQQTATQPTDTTAISAAVDMTVAENLFKQTCASCHVLPQTTKHTAAEWPNTVSRMQTKGRFDENHKAQITAYLVANARQ